MKAFVVAIDILMISVRDRGHVNFFVSAGIHIGEAGHCGMDSLLPCSRITPEDLHLISEYGLIAVNNAQGDHLAVVRAKHTVAADPNFFLPDKHTVKLHVYRHRQGGIQNRDIRKFAIGGQIRHYVHTLVWLAFLKN